ncbi:MAG: hypothetical protein COA78_36045 [Blastopirellula sp.]|nr:MAG: hypothetical protein COA78_36045 [Blastopirellula sp.]
MKFVIELVSLVVLLVLAATLHTVLAVFATGPMVEFISIIAAMVVALLVRHFMKRGLLER